MPYRCRTAPASEKDCGRHCETAGRSAVCSLPGGGQRAPVTGLNCCHFVCICKQTCDCTSSLAHAARIYKEKLQLFARTCSGGAIVQLFFDGCRCIWPRYRNCRYPAAEEIMTGRLMFSGVFAMMGWLMRQKPLPRSGALFSRKGEHHAI